MFQCANNQSTSISYICDGDNDCGDCSDELAEQGCTEPCVPGMWRADGRLGMVGWACMVELVGVVLVVGWE